jgi:hypothetical protein
MDFITRFDVVLLMIFFVLGSATKNIAMNMLEKLFGRHAFKMIFKHFNVAIKVDKESFFF